MAGEASFVLRGSCRPDAGSAITSGVTVVDGRITALHAGPGAGGGPDLAGAIELPAGAVVLPAFADHHLHLLSLAASRRSVDVSGARSLPEVFDLLRRGIETAVGATGRGAAGAWVRAWGIDETDLAEARLPTLDELDAVAGPCRLVLHHRTGHVRLASRAALLAGPETMPALSADELAEAVSQLGAELAAVGLVTLTDATHTNDAAALDLLGDLQAAGVLPQRLVAMVGVHRLAGLRFGETHGSLRVGPAKIMPPDQDLGQVRTLVAAARRVGFPVAVHAVDVDEVQASLDAGLGHEDRIEHLGLCLPEQLEALVRAGISVVTQPSFVTRRRAKYEQQLTEVERAWLYRLGSLLAAGVVVLGSSDAPVVPAHPLEQVASAVTRAITPSERIDVESALRLITAPLQVGGPADLVVLAADPLTVPPGQVAAIAVLATWRDGKLLHATPGAWPPAPAPTLTPLSQP